MSWSMRKAGGDKEALKAAVREENAPNAVKEEICRRIDATTTRADEAIFVDSNGHMEEGGEHVFRGTDSIIIRVSTISFTG